VSSEPEKTPHSPARLPPSTTSSSVVKSVKVVDLGDRWEVQLPGKPVFTIPKEGAERYLETFEKLPQPEGLTPEEASAVLEAIEGSRSSWREGRDWFIEALAEAVAKTSATALTTERAVYGEVVSRPITLGEVVLAQISQEVIESRNVPAIATELAVDFIERYKAKWFVVKDVELGIHCWDGRRYRECETFIYEYLEHNYDYYGMDSRKIRRSTLLKEFTIAVKGRTRCELTYEPLAISFNNWVIDWEALLEGRFGEVFREHNPELMVFHHVPHDINKELVLKVLEGSEGPLPIERFEELAKQYTPKTYKAFRTWVGDKWVLLYEIVGVVLYPKHVKKAFLIYGSTDSGKSTYLRFLEKLIGSENYSSVKLQDVLSDEQRFKKWSLYRKLANIYADLPAKALKNLGGFKELTGGDSIEVERKFRDSFTWDNVYVKFIFSCNKPPKIVDLSEADEAFWNRWVVVKFPESIPKERQVKDFEDTLLPEAPNVLALSVLAFYSVVRRGWVFSFENTAEDAKNEWLTKSDSIYAWLTARKQQGLLVEDPGARTESGVLYNDYVAWCKEVEERAGEEVEKVTQDVFTKRLKKFYKTVTKQNKTYFLLRLLTEPGPSTLVDPA